MADALIVSETTHPFEARATTGDARVAHQVVLAVENMHCGNCIRKVEMLLLGIPGVVSARANLSTHRVAVVTRGTASLGESLIRALRDAGFSANLLDLQKSANVARADSDLLRRLGVAGFAMANIMLLSVSVWSGHGSDMPTSLQSLFHWLSALIALPAIAYAGQPFFRSARQALLAGRLNMDVPISLGVCLATAMSVAQTWRGSQQVYFDAAISLLFFLLIGRVLDLRVRQRATDAAENLLGLRSPVTSVIAVDGSVARVATSSVSPGTQFLIAAGERIPLDGTLCKGEALIDESLLSGESRPRRVPSGEQIFAGTIALSGPHQAIATAVADSTMLADLARLMQAAMQARGRSVRLADRAAQIYAPAVHLLGAATFVGWLVAGQGWEAALTAAIAVLIITCPCALALAVPVVQVVACNRLFRSGIILKAADGLERLAEVDTVVFDKTGTLTIGEPRLLDSAGISDAVLQRAAGLAVQSHHPYSRAIAHAARARKLVVQPAPNVEEIAGAGVRCVSADRLVRLGSATFCDVASSGDDTASLWFRDGDTTVHAFHFSDPLRSDAISVVQALRGRSLDIELLSGDRMTAVAETAVTTGLSDWRAAQRPGEKIARLDELKRQGRKVLMVGDGLNDAPALAAAHASLSPSTAAEISQTAADAIFQGEKLAPVLELLSVAKSARRFALANFAIAIGYNLVFVPLAMLGRVTPLIAAVAMSASSIAVTLNALRLGRIPKVKVP